jgi:hypothetical protein
LFSGEEIKDWKMGARRLGRRLGNGDRIRGVDFFRLHYSTLDRIMKWGETPTKRAPFLADSSGEKAVKDFESQEE